LDALRLRFKGHGYAIETVKFASGLARRPQWRTGECDILLIDMNYARTPLGTRRLGRAQPETQIEDAPPVSGHDRMGPVETGRGSDDSTA